MNDEARYVYEEQLRLIGEEEVCAVEAAHLSAALRRIDAHRRYIREQERNLLAFSRESGKAKDISNSHETPIVHITNNVITSTANAPTYNQNGDGGQYIAEHMYTIPDINQQSFP